MNWLVKTLARAVVAGVGWKIGTDVYERAKSYFQDKREAEPATQEEPEEEPVHSDVEDVVQEPKPAPQRSR